MDAHTGHEEVGEAVDAVQNNDTCNEERRHRLDCPEVSAQSRQRASLSPQRKKKARRFPRRTDGGVELLAEEALEDGHCGLMGAGVKRRRVGVEGGKEWSCRALVSLAGWRWESRFGVDTRPGGVFENAWAGVRVGIPREKDEETTMRHVV